MNNGAPYRYDDLRALRADVHKLVAAGDVFHNVPYIKSKGHIEVARWLINTVLRHGAYRFDKASLEDHTRFNALGYVGTRQYKVVFEIVAAEPGRILLVITAYEVDTP